LLILRNFFFDTEFQNTHKYASLEKRILIINKKHDHETKFVYGILLLFGGLVHQSIFIVKMNPNDFANRENSNRFAINKNEH